MSLISPNFDVKSIFFSQFWLGAFALKLLEKALLVIIHRTKPILEVGPDCMIKVINMKFGRNQVILK